MGQRGAGFGCWLVGRCSGFKAEQVSSETTIPNKKDKNSIYVLNIDGPLNHLSNNWLFIEQNNFTEVYFDIDFEIKNKFLNIFEVPGPI